MVQNKKITIQGSEISVISQKHEDYISLTDMARSQMQEAVIIKWLSLKSTIEYLGEWEILYNPDFNYTEFGTIKNASGSNNFVLSAKHWIENTGAIGINAKAGRYGGTYAHKDIAFHFGMWISPKFQLLLVKEYQRLKTDENDRLKLEWNLQRTLAKVNYHIHTDAIKENLIPAELTKTQITFIYANEADLLNVALFGKTALQWRGENPDSKGNIRDSARIEQLVVLSNMESINAVLIRQGLPQSERLVQLNKIAIAQMTSLVNAKGLKSIHKLTSGSN
ncbi:MAG TPA: KilA-N domain-containing protein [Draconibacterium sp.]|nr:KilA-N domain-containing protein [Draconibacterium sp.]